LVFYTVYFLLIALLLAVSKLFRDEVSTAYLITRRYVA